MKKDKKLFKRANVSLPKLVDSNTVMRLKRENRNIIQDKHRSGSFNDQIVRAKKEQAEDIAFQLLEVIPDDHIADVTGLSLSEVKRLRRDSGLL